MGRMGAGGRCGRSLDIETGIETFRITVLILRVESRLEKSLDIETGIEAQKLKGIPVIETLARVTDHICTKV